MDFFKYHSNAKGQTEEQRSHNDKERDLLCIELNDNKYTLLVLHLDVEI